ncbi:hypothetical protein GCM10022221_53030 [Actinocorallia aurea]
MSEPVEGLPGGPRITPVDVDERLPHAGGLAPPDAHGLGERPAQIGDGDGSLQIRETASIAAASVSIVAELRNRELR